MKTPPPRTPASPFADSRRRNAEKSEMLEELFGDIFRCMEETLTDELSKTEVGIMKRHITLSKLEKKFTLFAGDKEQRVDLETKKAALACMDAAIATLTDFLEAHPAPENTIFNL